MSGTRFDTTYPRGEPSPDRRAREALEAARAVVPSAIAVLEDQIAEGRAPGAQLYVSRAGEPLANAGMGWARAGVPMTERTYLPWFCTAKPALAIAFAQLWEEGLVAPDTPVCAVVPEFRGGGKDAITYRHLLTHTAGLLPDPVYSAFGDRDAILRAISDAVLPPGVRPGRQAAYSGLCAWFALAETIERLTGVDYRVYLRERTLEPLGIDDAHIGLDDRTLERIEPRLGLIYDTDVDPPLVLPHLSRPHDFTRRMPGVDGIGSISALGRLYESFLPRGPAGVLAPQTRDALTARHRVGLFDVHHGSYLGWGLGITVDGWAYGSHCSPCSFGHAGLMTSYAFGDPVHDLVIASVWNGMSDSNFERDHRLISNAVYQDLGLGSEPGPAPHVYDVEPDHTPPWADLAHREMRFWRVEVDRGPVAGVALLNRRP